MIKLNSKHNKHKNKQPKHDSKHSKHNCGHTKHNDTWFSNPLKYMKFWACQPCI